MMLLSSIPLFLPSLVLSASLEPRFEVPSHVIADLKGMEYVSNKLTAFIPGVEEKTYASGYPSYGSVWLRLTDRWPAPPNARHIDLSNRR